MKGSRRTIIILVVVLVALVALWLGLRTQNENQSAREEEGSTVSMYSDLKDPDEITYDTGEEKIDLEKNADGKWIFPDAPDVTLDQSTVEMIAEEVVHPTVTRELEDPDDLADYGLEDPAFTAEALNDDGEELTVLVGDPCDDGYYLKNSDSDSVYTGGDTLVEYLQYTSCNLVQNDTLPTIGSDQVQEVTIETPKGTTTYTPEENEDDIATILGGYGSLSFGVCVAYNVSTDAELAQYGLDKDNRKSVSITYTTGGDTEDEDNSDTAFDEEENSDEETKTLTLYVGSDDAEEVYTYLMLEGSLLVNEDMKESVENMLNESN